MSAHDELAIAIDAWLPQTQCTRCGYPRCRDYADALASGEVDLNRCPPGGQQTINGLADLLDRPARDLDPEVGLTGTPVLAVIREHECIGCTMCIQACPVDAISGAGKLMHTVISDLCTGCELCVAPCPVDCIDLVEADRPPATDSRWIDFDQHRVDTARERTQKRLVRLARSKAPVDDGPIDEATRESMRAEIAAAVARGRARRENRGGIAVSFHKGGNP